MTNCKVHVVVAMLTVFALTVGFSDGKVMASLFGDADHNGTVDGWDLLIVQQCYNISDDNLNGDFNNDGIINGYDLNVVLSNYNTQPATASKGAVVVPEPAMFVLLAVGVLIFLSWAAYRRIAIES